MIIQFNADKNLKVSEAFSAKLTDLISQELSRFSNQITRVEVHLSDENGPKHGLNDKRCLIEARLEGIKPIAVTSHGNNHELAVESALDKLKKSLDATIGRMRGH